MKSLNPTQHQDKEDHHHANPQHKVQEQAEEDITTNKTTRDVDIAAAPSTTSPNVDSKTTPTNQKNGRPSMHLLYNIIRRRMKADRQVQSPNRLSRLQHPRRRHQ